MTAFTNRVQSGSRLRPQRRAALLRRSCRLRRGLAAAVVSAVVISTAAGCGGDDGASALPPLDTTAATVTASPTPTPTPTEDPDAWKSDYDKDQLRAYDEALALWQKYETRSEPIWAAGKVTADAEKLFKKYWITWPIVLNNLRNAQKFGQQVFGLPEVIRSQASWISLNEDLSTVTIRQCIDTSGLRVEYGPDVEVQDGGNPRPYVRTITMVQRDGDPSWLVRSLADRITEKEVERCGR